MNTPLEEQRCENCRYLHLIKLECRRNAPQPSDREGFPAWWPIIDDHDWCGEWVER